jgi:hypothetical protein
MNAKVYALLAAILLLLLNSAFAQTKLEFKFPDERKTKTMVKVTSQQTLTLNNMPTEIASEQEMAILTSNGKRAEDGSLRQSQKIESLKAKLTMPGGVVLSFDSANPNQAPPGTQYDLFLDLIKTNANANWSVNRDKDNRVTSIEGRDKVLDSLDETKRELVKRQIDGTYLRDKANQEMEKVPSKPVSKGDTWELSETMRLEGGQSMTLKTKYTYQGEVDRNGKKVHQIDLEATDVSYAIDADAATPLKLISSNLKPKMVEGVIYFDQEAGQVVEAREKIQITGDLKFTVSGNELAGKIDLTMGSSSVVE